MSACASTVDKPEEAHAAALTREEVTPAVHYVRFGFSKGQIEALAVGPAALVATHLGYEARTPFEEATRAELVGHLRGPAMLAPLG
jgi:hypothetical protein